MAREKEPARAKKVAKTKSPKAAKPQRPPNQEAPSLVPGTVLRKSDRQGKARCECTVEVEGWLDDVERYKEYPSPEKIVLIKPSSMRTTSSQ